MADDVEGVETVKVKLLLRMVGGTNPSKPTINEVDDEVEVPVDEAKRLVLAEHAEASSTVRKKLGLD